MILPLFKVSSPTGMLDVMQVIHEHMPEWSETSANLALMKTSNDLFAMMPHAVTSKRRPRKQPRPLATC